MEAEGRVRGLTTEVEEAKADLASARGELEEQKAASAERLRVAIERRSGGQGGEEEQLREKVKDLMTSQMAVLRQCVLGSLEEVPVQLSRLEGLWRQSQKQVSEPAHTVLWGVLGIIAWGTCSIPS